MKILFCFSSINIGGLEIFTINLAEKLAEKGKDVGILVFESHGKALSIIRNRKIKVFCAKRKGKFNPSFLLNVYKIIKSFKPDIVVSLSDFSYFFVEFVKRLSHIPAPHFIVFHSHSWLPLSLKGILLSKLFMLFSKLWNAYYIFISIIQSRHYQGNYALSKKRSFVVYNAVDTVFFVPIKSEKNDSFTIIHIANILLRKDQWTLFRSLERLNRDLEKWRLIFVGEDRVNLLNEFKTYLRDKGILDKVHFAQVADRKAIKKLLSESDVFVLTSTHEMLPIAALEAMAAGLPCILTNVGGCSEIVIDGYNGYLIGPMDEKAAADRLLRLYKNPDLLREMNRNARKTAEEKFDLDKCAENYMRVFNTMNDRHKG